jgi:hypothetical protein
MISQREVASLYVPVESGMRYMRYMYSVRMACYSVGRTLGVRHCSGSRNAYW